MSTLSSLRMFYARELKKLREEIAAYPSEESLWLTSGQVKNSGANLAMHLVGNLNTYIGARLGATSYVRDRPFEFAGRDIPQATLVASIEDVTRIVDRTLSGLTDADLEKIYPEATPDGEATTGHFLIHLAMHLTYHLGQINYHRRLLPF
jgi:uncharacterized damage-inducible protein DinB